jgi:flagellar M-ring protein FliF
MAADITSMLTSVLGPLRSSVVVRADLDFDERSTETETFNKDSSTPLKEQTRAETFSGAGTPPAGSVGVEGAAVDVSGDGTYSYERNEQTSEFGIDRIVTRAVQAPGAVERLSVAVVVDDGSLTGLGTPSTEDLSSLVAAAVGLIPDRGDTIQVTAVPFPAPEEVLAEEPSTPSPIMALIPQVLGGLVLLAVAAGLFLMSRSKAPEADAAGFTPAALPAGSGTPEPISGVQQDVLALVERQPEEIATLLRGWLADRREPT